MTANVFGALKPGGRFVISDLPFPDIDAFQSNPTHAVTYGRA